MKTLDQVKAEAEELLRQLVHACSQCPLSPIDNPRFSRYEDGTPPRLVVRVDGCEGCWLFPALAYYLADAANGLKARLVLQYC